MPRSIYCSTCKQEKEPSNLNMSLCKKCRSEYQKRKRLEKKLAEGKKLERDAYCDDCKNKKSIGISIKGRCIKCAVIMNRLRYHKNKIEAGLGPVRIYDSENCSSCGLKKINGRCQPCRNLASKQRKINERLAEGRRLWGSGRKPECSMCGKVKENIKSAYCLSCTSEDNKRRWREKIAPKVNVRPVTLICECGKQKKSTRKHFCDECLLIRKRKSTNEAAKRRRKYYKEHGYTLEAIPLTPLQHELRRNARNLVNRMLRQGLLERLPCEVCKNKKVEAHHDDYSKPLEIRWLCKMHHYEHHLTYDTED